MPKLLIINVTCNQGSIGRISEQVGLMMVGNGWEVFYAHGARRVLDSKLQVLPFSSVLNEFEHAFLSYAFDADGLGSRSSTRYLVSMIEKIKPDLIQIHNLHGYYLNYKILFNYLNKTDIPIVMTMHDCWSFTGHCVHFVTSGCDKWKYKCHDCPLLRKSPKYSLIDRSERNFISKRQIIGANKNLHIVAVSDWLGNLLKSSFYCSHPISVIHNGIDLSIFAPNEKRPSDKFRILGVSNVWNKDKGLEDFFKLREILSNDEFEISLVGLSDRQIKNLPEGIKPIPTIIDSKKLADIYSSSDVLVNPTYADTYPTINLESIACGTPVITYATGGSPESITPKTGKVVKVGDIKSLADSVFMIKEHPLSSKDCRDHAICNFNKDVCFKKYVDLYEKMV